jgi:hypothetical protein
MADSALKRINHQLAGKANSVSCKRKIHYRRSQERKLAAGRNKVTRGIGTHCITRLLPK